MLSVRLSIIRKHGSHTQIIGLSDKIFRVSVGLAQLEIPSNLDKLAKGTPTFAIVCACVCV
jgi:hypothetical protein